MPIRIADLLKKTRPITVEVEGETIALDYRPLWFNSRVEGQLRDAREGKLASEDLVLMFCECVATWEVLGPDGQMLPITPAAIAEYDVPHTFLRLVLNAVAEDQRVGKGIAPTSDAGSNTEAPQG